MLALLTALTAAAPAQVQLNILHVYVDPIFGDDAEAFKSNPGMSSNPPPFAQHPDAPQFPADSPRGKIRHAPYSFRTLTGTGGVKAYLDAIDGLLYNESATAIIHCLPGLYGPFLSGPGATIVPIDPRSGLQYNGENWPFILRWKWSLQGTSALDTIFDGRGRPTSIIVVQADLPGQLSHQDSIIDSLTIRGARSDNQPVSPFNCTGAGICVSAQSIAVGRGVQIGVTISNCFLVDNHVGVAVDNDNDPEGDPTHVNRPRIINNTFARNWIGLWSGSMNPAEPNIGMARIFLINDIFDSWRPDVGGVGTTPFVGIHPYEIAVGAVRVAGTSNYTDLNPIRSYCAWEAGRENLGVALPNWPIPAVQAYTPPYPAPRVDLRLHAGVTPGLARGTLYINDIFRNAGIQAVPGVEYSAHDFRLAASANKEPTPPGLLELNPLVNQGIYVNGPAGGSITGIRIARKRFSFIALPPDIEAPPGPAGELNATLHAWDLDCEGFGNPRALNRSYYTVGSGDYDTDIDIGADEMDELIIAGYINGTRVLGTLVPNAGLAGDHRRLFFVNVNDTVNWQRPWYNSVDGKTFSWWSHVQGAPDGAMGTNYTAGVPGSLRATTRVFNSKPLFMRNLECDFSPHLLSDPHSMWPLGFPGTPVDIYASNPWWWHIAPQGGPGFRHDNGALYDNSDLMLWQDHGSNNVIAQPPFLMLRTAVLSGTINPPATGLFSGGLFLHLSYTVAPFLSVSPCRAGFDTTVYSVDARGLGDAGPNCPDLVPAAPSYRGLRLNFQGVDVGNGLRNLQTLLSADGLPPVVDAAMMADPTPEAAARHGRMVEARLRRR